ncbi:MAG: hypothetical protein ACI906_004411 [Candidatus Latescibacterota bacterium]|jgi:hypothetical protein
MEVFGIIGRSFGLMGFIFGMNALNKVSQRQNWGSC